MKVFQGYDENNEIIWENKKQLITFEEFKKQLKARFFEKIITGRLIFAGPSENMLDFIDDAEIIPEEAK